MSNRPVILLDVDGVLNRFPRLSRVPRRPDEFDDFQTAQRGGFLITYSPECGRRLAALDADIHWLTTWDDSANREIGSLFGWEPLPVIARADHDQRVGINGWWKSSAAREFLDADRRPFVWLDDDLYGAERRGEIEWVGDYSDHLLISPQLGLLPRHLDEIEAWIDGLNP